MATYQITTSDGSVYEIVTKNNNESLYKKDITTTMPNKKYPTKLGTAATVLDSLALGYGDELSGVVGAGIDTLLSDKTKGETFKERYHNWKTLADEAQKEFRERNPLTGIVIDVLTPNPVSKIKLLDRLGKAGKAVGTGALTGGIYGTGAADSKDVLEQGVQASLMGGALSGGMYGLGKGVKGTYGVARNIFSSPEKIATEKIGDTLRETAEKEISRLTPEQLLKPTTLAEELQNPVLAQAQKIAEKNIPEAGSVIAENREAKKRIVRNLFDELAPDKASEASVRGEKLREVIQRNYDLDKGTAEEIYAAVKSDPVITMPSSKKINNLLNTYLGKTGEPDSHITKLIKRINENRESPIDIEEWQKIRGQANDVIQMYNVPGASKQQQAIAKGIKDLLDESIEMAPLSPQTRKTWEAANESYKQMQRTYLTTPKGKQSKIGKILESNKDKYVLEASKIQDIYDGRPETAKALLNAVGPENKDVVRALVVGKWEQKATTPDLNLSPNILRKTMLQESEAIKEIFDKKHLKNLKIIDEYLSYLSPSSERSVKSLSELASKGQSVTSESLIRAERAASEAKRFSNNRMINSTIGFIVNLLTDKGDDVDRAIKDLWLKASYDKKLAQDLLKKPNPSILSNILEKTGEIGLSVTDPSLLGKISGQMWDKQLEKEKNKEGIYIKRLPNLLEENEIPIIVNDFFLVTPTKEEEINFDGINMSKEKAGDVDLTNLISKQSPLIRAVIGQESAGNPIAVSRAGAQGLMQLMPATGREVFQKLELPGEYDPYDPELNIKLGTHYLNEMIDKFQDLDLALAAYNAGPGRVKRLINEYGSSFDAIRPYLPQETRDYVFKVKRNLNRIVRPTNVEKV